MKEEILSIANDAIRAIDEFENYLFANHRAKYAMSKSILDQHREHITQIKKGLELGLDDAGFNEIRSDLGMIINDVTSARNGNYELKEPVIDTTEVDQMLNSLNENRVETQYPTGDININNINSSINTLENASIPNVPTVPTVPPVVPAFNAQPVQTEAMPQGNANPVQQVDMTSDIDINALNAFMSDQAQ